MGGWVGWMDGPTGSRKKHGEEDNLVQDDDAGGDNKRARGRPEKEMLRLPPQQRRRLGSERASERARAKESGGALGPRCRP